MTEPSTLDDPRVFALAREPAGALCDACLGRMFARIGDGLGNLERGRRLRGTSSAVPSSRCALCEGLVERVEGWAALCVQTAKDFEYASFLVGSVTFDDLRQREMARFEALKAADTQGLAAAFEAKTNSPPWTPGEWLKTEINREVGRRIEGLTGKKPNFDRPDLTFRLDTRFDHVALQVADVFVRGRYRKLVRDLPQTRWPCRACGGIGCRQCGGTGKTYETSVEELVAAPFLRASGATQEAFHGMGREDIDARTLGNGRPFILELKNPRRRTLDEHALQEEVNRANADRVEVLDMAPAGPKDAATYKAADPDKTYQAVCLAAGPVEPAKLVETLRWLEGVELEQRTPQRVAHRRADLVRKRTVSLIRVLDHRLDRFTLEITADSGTYIKEFVSGDEGRTRPSIAERLGLACRVIELDVVGVHWGEGPHSIAPPTTK